MSTKTKYKLSFTASEIDNKLKMVNQLSEDISRLAPEDIGAMPNIPVTSTDNGKFLCVVNGTWVPTTIEDAEELSY